MKRGSRTRGEGLVSRAENTSRDEEQSDSGDETSKALFSNLNNDDYYQTLGLENLRWRATEEDIRSAYRSLVLKYHPDKMADPKPEDRQIFIKIQEAYDVLGTLEKRRA